MVIDNQDVRWFAALGVIVLVVFAFIFLPRYEWRTVTDAGSVSIIVYDRWTGRMQRGVYDTSGKVNASNVWVPF